MALDFRLITDDEIKAFRETISVVFGGDLDEDTGGPERFKATVEKTRRWGAFDRGAMVATSATFTLVIGVPGGDLAMGGLTMVSVRPSHRRRGILTELMRLHVADSKQRGEVIQGLWASESTIYQRYGFGIATECDDTEIAAGPPLDVRVPGGGPDTLDTIDEAAARTILPGVYERATKRRPGILRRNETWWRERRFLEAQFVRHGASRLRHVVARRGDEVVGYVAYRQRGSFDAGRPTGRADIIELQAVDARAEATLWRFALTMDLYPNVTWWNAPTDCILPWIISDMRRIKRRRSDGMWIRVDDVPGALAARRYAAEDILRLRIDGTTWELVVEDGTGHCTPSDREPDIELDRAALGSLFLGGVSAQMLGRAGRITGDPGALARADRLFAWPVAPWCAEIF